LWGETPSGSPRFRCKTCNITFVWQRPDKAQQNRFSWFYRWLLGISIPNIAASVGKHPRTIRRTIHHFLDNPPRLNPVPKSNCHLIIDGTWFGRKNCLIVYWNKDLRRVQYWNYTIGERTLEILRDLRKLRKAGVIPTSVTSKLISKLLIPQ